MREKSDARQYLILYSEACSLGYSLVDLTRHPEYPERTLSSIEKEAEGVSKGTGY